MVGGALAEAGQWRWLFCEFLLYSAWGCKNRELTRWVSDLNLPICAVAATLIFMFVNLRTPAGSFRDKIGRMDWMCVCLYTLGPWSRAKDTPCRGNAIITAGSSGVVIALTWGGVEYPWTSPRVLVPLVLGVSGVTLWLVYEARWAKNPIVCSMWLRW